MIALSPGEREGVRAGDKRIFRAAEKVRGLKGLKFGWHDVEQK